jgi:predicted enzyme related to lactoylglutathione lyase
VYPLGAAQAGDDQGSPGLCHDRSLSHRAASGRWTFAAACFSGRVHEKCSGSNVVIRSDCERDTLGLRHRQLTRCPTAAGIMRDMITGMHAIVFSPDAAKVREFFADVLDLRSVDAGGGWLIFALPPAELAVHPADGDGRHELYLMCDDIQATLAELRAKGVEVARDVTDQGWGLLAAIRLPDGGEFPIYQPRHPSPRPA